MNDKPFSTIFYPESIEPFPPHEARHRLPLLLITPDAAYLYGKKELRAAYDEAVGTKPRLMIVLSPLHQSVRDDAEGAWAFLPEGGRYMDLPLKQLQKKPTWLTQDDGYFEEEPAPEEQCAILHTIFPDTDVLPILADSSLEAGRMHKLSDFLASLLEEEPEALVVLSLNASTRDDAKAALASAQAFTDLLTTNSPCLDALHKHRISSLGAALVDAVDRLAAFKEAGWKILGFSYGDRHMESLPETVEAEGKGVWHIAAFKETSV